MTSTDAPVSPAESIRISEQLAGAIARLFTGTIALAYVGGMIVVSVHLGRNGFSWLGLFQPAYLIAGLWTLLIALIGGIPAVSAQLIYSRIKEEHDLHSDERPAASLFVPRWTPGAPLHLPRRLFAAVLLAVVCGILPWFVSWRSVSLLGVLVLLFVTAVLLGLIAGVRASLRLYVGLVVAWSFLALLCAAFDSIGVAFSPQTIAFIGGSSLLSLVISRQVRFLWFHLTQPSSQTQFEKVFRLRTTHTLLLIVLLAPIYFATFSIATYKDIPFHLGGGQPTDVRLLLTIEQVRQFRSLGIVADTLSLLSDPIPAFMATETELFLRPSPTHRGVVLRRSDIQALTFP